MIIGIVIDTNAKTADIYDGDKHKNLYNADLYELIVKQIPRGVAEIYRDGKGEKDGK